MPAPVQDRNLLFAILALQMEFVTRDQLIVAMNEWVLAKDREIASILVEDNALDPRDRELLDRLVDRHLDRTKEATPGGHANPSHLPTTGQIFEAVGDSGIEGLLSQLSTDVGGARDPEDESTAPYVAGPPRDDVLPPPSLTAGRYKVVRPFRGGGLGYVSIAKDGELGREVAFKEIQPKHADHPDFRARFVIEAEINGNLEHPAIVPVYGKGEHADGRPYYAMRFVRGEGLDDAIRAYHAEFPKLDASARSLRLRDLLGSFVTVCQAIAYAHARGVIHRDLKPANILRGEYGETLLIDWGLAKATGHRDKACSPKSEEVTLLPPSSDTGSPHPTRAGSAFGTVRYMAPEQAATRPYEMGTWTDVYGLGATLYNILTGKPPIEGPIEDAEAKVLKGEIIPPRQIVPSIPKGLEAICLKAMSLKPEDRYESALSLASDVTSWLADEPVSVLREPLSVRIGRWARRNKTLVAAAATLLVAGIVGLAIDDFRVKSERNQAIDNLLLARGAVNKIHRQIAEGQLPAVPLVQGLRKDVSDATVELTEEILRRSPGDLKLTMDAAHVNRVAGNIDRTLGHYKDSASHLDRSVDYCNAVLAHTPDAVTPKLEMALALIDSGDTARYFGGAGKAEEAYKKAHLIASTQGKQANPLGVRGPNARLIEAHALTSLAGIHSAGGKHDEASKAAGGALDILDPMGAEGQLSSEGRLLHAQACQAFAEARAGVKDYSRAEASFVRGITICDRMRERLKGKDPGPYSTEAIAHNFAIIRAATCMGLGRALAEQASRWPDAERYCAEAIEEYERLSTDAPLNPEFIASLATGYQLRAQVRRLLHKEDDARSDEERGRRVGRSMEFKPAR